MKKHFIAAILISGTVLVACEKKSVTQNNLNVTFDALSYDSMRAFYSADSAFLSMLNNKVNTGDPYATNVKKMLATPYDQRDATGFSDNDIGTIMASYRVSRDVINRFNEIKKTLPDETAEAIRAKTDSVLKQIEEMKEKYQNK